MVAAPANPRRSRGGDFAFEISTNAFTVPGDRTFNQQEIILEIDRANPKVTYRDLRVAHVTRHTLPREDPRRKRRCANRTLDLEHVTM